MATLEEVQEQVAALRRLDRLTGKFFIPVVGLLGYWVLFHPHGFVLRTVVEVFVVLACACTLLITISLLSHRTLRHARRNLGSYGR